MRQRGVVGLDRVIVRRIREIMVEIEKRLPRPPTAIEQKFQALCSKGRLADNARNRSGSTAKSRLCYETV